MHVLRRASALCLLMIFLLSVGCAAPPAQPTRILLLEHTDANEMGYTIGYVRSLATSGEDRVVAAEVLGDLLVVVESPSNLVTAVDVNTGEVRWRYAVKGGSGNVYGPYRYEDMVMVNSDIELHVLEAEDGRLIRKQSLDGAVVSSAPALSERFAVFGSIKGRAMAVDVTTGLVRWKYQLANGIIASPLATGNTVFVADQSGVYAMLDGVTGDPIWRGRAFGRISAKPVADQTRVYVPSEDQGLYVLSRTTGRDQWTPPFRTTVPLTQSPLVSMLDVFLPLPGKGLVSLRTANGQENWRTDLQVKPIHYADDRLLAMGSDRLFKINTNNGHVATQTPTASLAEVLVGPNNTLILISADGRINQLVPMRSGSRS